jgi:hypothetical protein
MAVKSIAICVLALALSPLPLAAGDLMMYSDLDFSKRSTKCFNGGTAVDVHFVYVPSVHDGAEPISGIQFRIPTPECMVVPVRVDIRVQPNTVGNSETGVTVVFSGCMSAPVHVLTVRLFSVNVLQGCCAFTPLDAIAMDCAGNEIAVQALPAYFGNEPCDFDAPHSPTPADGATISSLNTTLQWQAAWNIPSCDLGDVRMDNVYFGTNPVALAKYTDVGASWPVTGLSAGVTYYWRGELTTINGAGPYQSPLWSFTTEGALTATPSTWGHIKALYR